MPKTNQIMMFTERTLPTIVRQEKAESHRNEIAKKVA
jgi:hypothetical protein